MPEGREDYASKFMLREYTRIIDAYHDLHRQKDALIKFYLAFVSLPVSIVGIYLALANSFPSPAQSGGAITPQPGSILQAIQTLGFYLSILLVFVGAAVMMVMLKIRAEQYLYIQTINGTRKYFKEVHGINAESYLVLPSETNRFSFGNEELSGRAFWEAMIVSFTSCMLLGFLTSVLLTYAGVHGYCLLIGIALVFIFSVFSSILFIRNMLRAALRNRKMWDAEVTGSPSPPSAKSSPSGQTPVG